MTGASRGHEAAPRPIAPPTVSRGRNSGGGTKPRPPDASTVIANAVKDSRVNAVILTTAASSDHGGLAWWRVAFGRLDLLAHLSNDVLVDERIQVETQHVQQPPVTQRALLADDLDSIAGHHAVLHVDEARADGGHEDHDGAHQQHAGQHGGQDDVPEPDEDEGLLVDNVECENAERVVTGHRSGGAEFVEHALGEPREYVYLARRQRG